MNRSNSQKVSVFYPNQKLDDPFLSAYSKVLVNLWVSRELIWQLFKRDFFSGYKKSFLGNGWMILTPIFGILSWVLMQFTGVVNPGVVNVPYPVYVLIGSTCWGVFLGLFEAGTTTFSAASNLLQQVKYPHEIIIAKQILLKLAQTAISLLMVLLILAVAGYLDYSGILPAMLMVIPIAFWALSFGLVMAIFSIILTDISRLVSALMGLLIYTVPVIYSADVESPLLRMVNKFNPLTYPVCNMRDLLLGEPFFKPTELLISTGAGFLLLLVVWRFFYISEDRIIEKMV